MTDHVALMREHAAQLRAQADRYDQAADLIEGETGTPAKQPKAKKEKRAGARPTRAGRKAGKVQEQVAEYLKKHPQARPREVATAIGAKYATVWSACRSLRS